MSNDGMNILPFVLYLYTILWSAVCFIASLLCIHLVQTCISWNTINLINLHCYAVIMLFTLITYAHHAEITSQQGRRQLDHVVSEDTVVVTSDEGKLCKLVNTNCIN